MSDRKDAGMSNRDKLIAEARNWNLMIGNQFARPHLTDADFAQASNVIERVLEVAELVRDTPRVVTTVAELDSLPLGSVVLDDRGAARMKRAGDSHMGAGWTQGGNHPIRSASLADGHPMTVLFTPTSKETE